MATQPCPGIAQINIIMSDDAQEIQNVLHFDNTVGALWPLADLVTLTQTVHTWWTDNMKPLLPSSLALVEVKATDLTSLAGQIYQEGALVSDVGDNAEQALPNNVTAALKFVVPERGRGVNGRMYWPGMTTGQIAAGSFITPLFEAATIAALEALDNAVTVALPEVQHVVLSRYLNKVKRAAGIGKLIIGYGFSDNTVDSQRDRLPGHKKHRRARPTP